jgi:16S rRNA G966 N2-methylase RsmD
LGYQILTHTHLLGESMTWNKEYRKMHQQLDQWCWISSQSSNLSRNLQESRQKLSVASSSWPIANAHKLRKQRYLFHPKERPPTTVSPSTFRKKMSVHCIKGYKICASDFARTDMKNMEARISGNVFWNHSQYVYLDPPNTPKMVDVRKLWSITQSFWIHTGIYIYIIKEVARSWSTLPHPHSAQQVGTKKIWDPWLPSRSLHLDPWSDNISSPWTDPQGLDDNVRLENPEWRTPYRKLVNWIIIWHGWGLQWIFVQWHKHSCGFIVTPTNHHMFESPFFYSNLSRHIQKCQQHCVSLVFSFFFKTPNNIQNTLYLLGCSPTALISWCVQLLDDHLPNWTSSSRVSHVSSQKGNYIHT